MAADQPLLPDEFVKALESLPSLTDEKSVAVGLSGGPDSMALTHLLCAARLCPVHALTVDHGLRPESGREAQDVAEWIGGWPCLTHKILKWEGDKPQARVMEEARAARYALMADYCREKGIRYLFLAHHQDDQAETFLIRLAGGSGLDGLAAMRSVQETEGGITLLRPFLDIPKARLVATCDENGIPYVRDPSNENAKYLRPRLRQAREILEEEGLSAKRLAATARRLGRARGALAEMAEQAFAQALKQSGADFYSFDLAALRAFPEEIGLRVILGAMKLLREDADYGPRLERAEALFDTIRAGTFKGATLGGCLFELTQKRTVLVIRKEPAAKS